MFWQITSFPKCDHHVFLSHCAEDRDWLVHPLHAELIRGGIAPWLDQHHHAYGRRSRPALQDGLLRSRHIVFLVTEAMLHNSRGWCAVEAAYADIVQANLDYSGGPLLNYVLPLFFLDPGGKSIVRTIWDALRDRGRFHRPSDGQCASWAAEQVAAFLRREQRLALDMAKVAAPGQAFHDYLHGRQGLIQRITGFDPGPVL